MRTRLTQDSLAASASYCRAVVRARAANFYFGLKLTPEPRRSALYAIYAWMRAADDVADGAGAVAGAVEQRRRRLEAFREATRLAVGDGLSSAKVSDRTEEAASVSCDAAGAVGAADPRLWPAMRRACADYRIDPALLWAMLDGQADDLGPVRMASFADLERYCWRVAGTVGLICVRVWGLDEAEEGDLEGGLEGGEAGERGGGDGWERVKPLAEARGVALQLTNILRDVREDAARGRCYLPSEDLTRHGLSTEAVLRGTGLSDGRAADWGELVRTQAARARGYYEASAGLEDRLDPACRGTSRAMTRVYRRLLELIEADPARVLHERVSLPRREKVSIALAAAGRWGAS